MISKTTSLSPLLESDSCFPLARDISAAVRVAEEGKIFIVERTAEVGS